MTINFTIPTPSGPFQFRAEPGTSLLFVGANGGGKTRLAVKIETDLAERAHRISAHRALILNPDVPKISERIALYGLTTGHPHEGTSAAVRPGSRWRGNPAVALLNDFDFLIQALFAEQTNTALATHKTVRTGNTQPPALTKFEQLVDIWNRVLPHRQLDITGDNIEILSANSKYAATDMSDGERAVFYLIGQTLMASQNVLLIFDEPELHIHRAILSRLWDELEAVRPDCAMVLISHDLEFVASREGQKFALSDYDPIRGWTIQSIPEESGFSEEITTLILGSRRPVLFVEGRGGSLDQAIYRACYPEWTIIPRGSCEEVIHSVVTMRANSALTRITCAGIVDSDAYEPAEIQYLAGKGIVVLPVSEIENLFLLPNVIRAIAMTEGYNGNNLEGKVKEILDELFQHASEENARRAVVMRYCRRQIDRTLKKVDLSAATDTVALAAEYSTKTSALDVQALAQLATSRIQKAIAGRDAAELLRWFDDKALMGIACKAKGTNKAAFEQWIVRTMRNNTTPSVKQAVRSLLPPVQAT
ncbi:MAG: AAA family ATPase [Proteobacteria bacterium]|nr:AAA family ATPase [Pseudomonadota bacterium]